MKTTRLIVSSLLALSSGVAAQSTPDLQGLWGATLRRGSDIRGPLLIFRRPDGWRADIGGFSVPVRIDGFGSPEETRVRRAAMRFAFELPDGKGSFRGGHWIQPGRFASPVVLEPDGKDRWRGTITPLEERITFFMPVMRQPDGTLRTYLRNPERNFGRFIRISQIELNGQEVRLVGRDTVQGRYDEGVLSLPLVGETFSFSRITDSTSPFYPRRIGGAHYQYTPPLAFDDGWSVAAVESVGISRDAIERLVQMLIDMPMDSVNTLQIHCLLIARHGKLVVEEHFHGYDRDTPHDTRSAAKSWTATLIGAAIQAGVPLRTSTRVYETLLDSLNADLDPRKREMTLEHLLTMTAGYNCDPDDPLSADEDQISQQDSIRDWHRHTLNVQLVSRPGEKIFYCSAEPNLAAGMLARVAHEHLPELFERLVARPLRMHDYYLSLTPLGEAYGGGGHRFRPRDFLKFPQLMVNGGKWNGKQIVASDWVRQSTAPLRDLFPGQQWGYLWNSAEYDYNGRKVRAFFAGGNGGQVFMGFPELDLVVGFTGGNYGAAAFPSQRTILQQYLLPAVR